MMNFLLDKLELAEAEQAMDAAISALETAAPRLALLAQFTTASRADERFWRQVERSAKSYRAKRKAETKPRRKARKKAARKT